MRRRSERRGVLLLVMLSMLSLLAVIVITYVVVAGIKKRAAAAYERAHYYGTPPEELLQSIALDLLRDTRNPTSALQGHSLLADLYGEDGVIGRVPVNAAVLPIGLVGSQTLVDRQLFELFVNISELVYCERPTVRPPGRLFDGCFSGCVITFLDGPFRNQSGRIVDYRAPAEGAATGSAKLVVATPLSGLGQGALAQLPGTRFVINGRPFNGVGSGFVRRGGGALDGELTRFLSVDGVDLPLAFALNHANASVRLWVDPAIGRQFTNSGSRHSSIFDEDYDAPDYMNPALAMMVPNPRGASPTQVQNDLSPSGSVVLKPSFYLPGLQSFYEDQLGMATGGMGADVSTARLWSMISLRPNPVLHPGFARQNPQLNLVGSSNAFDPYYQNPVLDETFVPPPWDVDNTGDGLTDSVWIDPGLPVQTASNGRRYKVLAAILCVDLDGRLNVNVHGAVEHISNITQRNQLTGPYAQDTVADLATPSTILLADAADAIGSGGEAVYPGMGYGPADVNLGLFDSQRIDRPPYLRAEEYAALLGGMQSSHLVGVPADTRVIGRYGADGGPGFSGLDSGLAARQPELLPPSAANSNSKWTAYAAPSDFAGTGVIALDHVGQPVYHGHWVYSAIRNFGGNPYELEPEKSQSVSGWWQSPFELASNPRSRSGVRGASGLFPRDASYSPGELERLLRWHDSDAESLPDRLLEVAKVGLRARFGGAFDVQPPVMLDHVTGVNENQGGLNSDVYLRQVQDAGRMRAMTTTESWDLPVPNLSTPADLSGAVRDSLGYEPLHITDLVAARIAQANQWDQQQILGTTPDAAARRSAINGAIQLYLSSEMRAGLRFNLNRPFGDGVDNDGDHTVDEGGIPREDGFADPGESVNGVDPADVAFVELMDANDDPARRKAFPMHASNGDRLAPLQEDLTTNDAMVRQIYARHLYMLAQILVNHEYDFPRRPLGVGLAESPEVARARALAQWAVNVVDYRDRDSAMTFFEYDVHPFVDNDPGIQGDAFWDVDGFPATDEDGFGVEAYRGVVWGAEKPELLITETMAWHDHRVAWLDDPPFQGWVEYARPVGSLLIELYNPRDPGAEGGELDVDDEGRTFRTIEDDIGGVALHRLSLDGVSPVWRLVFSDPLKLQDRKAMDAPVPPYEPVSPTDIQAAAYFVQEEGIGGGVWDAWENSPVKPQRLPNGATATLSVVDGLPAAAIRFNADRSHRRQFLPPGDYAVIGSGSDYASDYQTMYLGMNDGVFDIDDSSNAPNYPLTFRIQTADVRLPYYSDFKMFGRAGATSEQRQPDRDRRWTNAIAMRPLYSSDGGATWSSPPPTDGEAGEARNIRKLRFSVSEPKRGYGVSSADIIRDDFYDTVDSLADLQPPEPGLPAAPDDLLATENKDRVVGIGLDFQASQDTPTRERHAVVYLQRLADPARAFHMLDNPYISVDSAEIDVHAYTGDRRATDPRFINSLAELKIQSRERGASPGAGPLAQRQNIWFGKSPANSRELRARQLPDDAFDVANIDDYCSFGYLNTTFGRPIISGDTSDDNDIGDPLPSTGVGQPGGPFPWFPWADRPLVSAAELLLVPVHSPRALLSRHGTRTSAGSDKDRDPYYPVQRTEAGASGRQPAEGEFNYLASYFSSRTKFEEPATSRRDAVPALELHRILEFVHVPSRFSGLEDELFPTPIMANPQQMGQFRPWLDDLHIWPGFHYLNHYREPARVNANTVYSPDVWHCITGGLPAPRWQDLVLSRRGYASSADDALRSVSPSPYALNQLSTRGDASGAKVFPSLTSNPFRSYAGGVRQPLGDDGPDPWSPNMRLKREIDATLYRPKGVRYGGGANTINLHDAQDPLLSPDDDALAYDRANYDDERNPYFRYHGHQKLANLLTTRSNVYAVWITIGNFEVQSIRNEKAPSGFVPPFDQLPASSADQIVAELVPDGWQIGPELGSETGDVKRHRAFYLIDRTIPVGYLRGENLNVDDAMIIQRFIE